MLTVVVLFALSIGGCGFSTSEPGAGNTAANQDRKKAELLNQTADLLYQSVTAGKLDEAKVRLLLMEQQMTRIRFDGLTTVEGVHALSDSLLMAKRTFAAVNLSAPEWTVAAARVRLAADALTHPNEPMWLQQYKLFKTDIKRLADALITLDSNASKQAVQTLDGHYSLIRPAVWINRSPGSANKADSLLLFLTARAQQGDKGLLQMAGAIRELDKLIDELFLQKEQPTFLPVTVHESPIILIVFVALFILAVLLYAGWRKYKGDRHFVTVPRQDDHPR